MFCCGMSKKQAQKLNQSIQPNSQSNRQSVHVKSQYQKNSIHNDEKLIPVYNKQAKRSFRQNSTNFREQLQKDVKENLSSLKQFIDKIDNVIDFKEYQKVSRDNIEIRFKSIRNYWSVSNNQNLQISNIVQEMQQPYHLLIQVKKQLKCTSLSVLYFLGKIIDLANGDILEDEIFEKNKKGLNSIDCKIWAKFQEAIEQVKLLQRRTEGFLQVESNLKNELQLQMNDLKSAQSSLKIQNTMYETKINTLQKTIETMSSLKIQNQMYQKQFKSLEKVIQIMSKNIISISHKLQIPSFSDTAPKSDFEGQSKLKETLDELQFNKNEVSRLRQLLDNSQKESSLTDITEISKVKDRQIKNQQHQIVELKQQINRLEEQLKQKEQLYVNQIFELTKEKQGLQHKLQYEKDEQQYRINELQQSKANFNKIESQLVSYQRQMQQKIWEGKEQNQVLKNKLKYLESQLKDQKQLAMSLAADLQNQKTKNGNMYTSTFLEQRTFFIGDILQQKKQQKKYLITTIQQHMNMFIDKTKLLYQYKKDRLKNFHQSIDNHKNLVVIVQTSKALFAGYYSGVLQDKTPMTEEGLIISMNNFKFYTLNNLQNNPRKDPNDTRLIRGMVYDKYFLIVGNAQIRIRSGQDKVFSNFGIATSFYNNNRERVQALLGEGIVNQVKFNNYEIHEVTFDENCIYERVQKQ